MSRSDNFLREEFRHSIAPSRDQPTPAARECLHHRNYNACASRLGSSVRRVRSARQSEPSALYSAAVFPNHAPGILFHNEIAVHEDSIASESSLNPYDVGSTSGTCVVPIR